MTKDELKKKLEKKAEKECVLNDRIHIDCFVSGYLKGALPREKKIAKLKEQVNILENCDRLGDVIIDAYKDQLAQAKEIIAIGLRVCETSSIEYMNLYQKQAEQFLEKVK